MSKQNEAQIIETSKILLDTIQKKAASERLSFEGIKHLADAYALVVQNTPDEPVRAYVG